jgi:hypothetical protein
VGVYFVDQCGWGYICKRENHVAHLNGPFMCWYG